MTEPDERLRRVMRRLLERDYAVVEDIDDDADLVIVGSKTFWIAELLMQRLRPPRVLVCSGGVAVFRGLEFLAKPFTPDGLLDSVARAMARPLAIA